jgi:hypothetical protein
MNENTGRIEQYLQGIAAPEHVSDRHRQRLRREILAEMSGRRALSAQGRRWKLVLAAAALIGIALAGVALVGLEMGPGHDTSRNGDSRVHLIREQMPGPATPEGIDPESLGRAQEYLPTTAVFRQAGAAQLVKVVEVSTGGRTDGRTLLCQYDFSDGRTVRTSQADLKDRRATTLTAAQTDEASRLWHEGKGQNLGVQDKDVSGRTFSFRRQRIVLSDGTEVIWSVGEPKGKQ